MDQNMKSFTIPKKKKKKVDVPVEQDVPAPIKQKHTLTVVQDDDAEKIWKIVKSELLDTEISEHLKLLEVRRVHNNYLEWKFNQFKKYLRANGHPDTESFGYREIGNNIEADFIAHYGLRAATTRVADIGDDAYGVYVYRHPDTCTSSVHFYDNVPCAVMMFKTLRGKPYTVGLGSGNIEPQAGHFCHVAAIPDEERTITHRRRLEHRASAVFHYEFKPDGMSTYRAPAGVLPYAIITFQLSSGVLKCKSPLVSPRFPTFSTFPATIEPIQLGICSEKLLVDVCSPLRCAEIASALYDGEVAFASNPFFDQRKLDDLPDFAELKTRLFACLIGLIEVQFLSKQSGKKVYATYSVMKPHSPQFEPQMTKLVNSMRFNSLFAIGTDASAAVHILFPSGDISSSLGLPTVQNAIHVVSMASQSFFINEFDVAAFADVESKYLIRTNESHTEIRLDDEFEKIHEDTFKQFEIINADAPAKPQKPAATKATPAEQPAKKKSPVYLDDDPNFVPLPPVPLPPAGKGILYKPEERKQEGAPIGTKKKRRPHIRVKWATNVVDNDNKEKNSNMLEKEKEERRPLSDEEKEKFRSGTNAFKNVFETMKSLKEDEKKKEDKKEEEKIAFSSIRSLPLPPLIKPGVRSNSDEAEKKVEVKKELNEDKVEEDVDEDKDDFIDDNGLMIVEEDEEEEIEKKKKKKKKVVEEDDDYNDEEEEMTEKKEEKVEKRPEDNDILSFCMSSTRDPVTDPKTTESSILSILNLTDETLNIIKNKIKPDPDPKPQAVSADLDLRNIPTTSQQAEDKKPEKKVDDDTKDIDYRQTRFDRYPPPLIQDRDDRFLPPVRNQEPFLNAFGSIQRKIPLLPKRKEPLLPTPIPLEPVVKVEPVESPASPPPNMVTVSTAQPKPIKTEPMRKSGHEEYKAPISLLPSRLGELVEAGDGWDNKYNLSKKKRKREEKKELKKPRNGQPLDQDYARSTSKSLKHADNGWMDAIEKKKKKVEEVEEEEEGEIKSDSEDERDKVEPVDIIEDVGEIEVVNSAQIPQIPQVPQDRDERIINHQQRKSRFDAPPAIAHHPPQQQQSQSQQNLHPAYRAPPVFFPHASNGPAPRRGPMLPPPQGPPAVQFFNRAPPPPQQPAPTRFGPRPLMSKIMPPPPPLMQQGGPIPPRTFNGNGKKFTISSRSQAVIVVDSMMFNRAVMDSKLLRTLCEQLRRLQAKGGLLKMFVHKSAYDSMNDTQQSYRQVLEQHTDALVHVMDEHACDKNNIRSIKDSLSCMKSVLHQHPTFDVVYVSNLGQMTDYGQQLSSLGVRICKLDELMDNMRGCY